MSRKKDIRRPGSVRSSPEFWQRFISISKPSEWPIYWVRYPRAASSFRNSGEAKVVLYDGWWGNLMSVSS
jgi:hypothetical protein